MWGWGGLSEGWAEIGNMGARDWGLSSPMAQVLCLGPMVGSTPDIWGAGAEPGGATASVPLRSRCLAFLPLLLPDSARLLAGIN